VSLPVRRCVPKEADEASAVGVGRERREGGAMGRGGRRGSGGHSMETWADARICWSRRNTSAGVIFWKLVPVTGQMAGSSWHMWWTTQPFG